MTILKHVLLESPVIVSVKKPGEFNRKELNL